MNKPRRLELDDKYILKNSKSMFLVLRDLDFKPTDENDDFNDIVSASVHIEDGILKIALGDCCYFNNYNIKNYELLIMIYDDVSKIFEHLMDDIMYHLTFDVFTYA